MLNTYLKLWAILDTRERRRALIVFALVLVVALVETGGVASIMPFIAVLSRPEVVETNHTLSTAYRFLGFRSREGFLLAMGVAVFVIFMFSLVMKVLGAWAQARFSQNRNHSWGCRLMAGYLGQPYEWFLNQHSAELSASVLTEVNQVVNNALLPAMQAISGALITVCLVALLVAVEPVLAIGAAVMLGGMYGIVELASRARLSRIGIERRNAARARYKVLQEALGGVKDVKVGGLESQFVGRFSVPSQKFAETQISATLISQLPSFAMQGILFGALLLAILYLLATRGDFKSVLPVISVFALAGYRLMPALQLVFQSVAKIRFMEAAVDSLAADLGFVKKAKEGHASSAEVAEPVPRISLDEAVELRNVTYTYPEASQPTLRGLSLHVPARATHGLVGSTGSGKTTMIDMLLGLLEPETGALVVDGVVVEGDLVPRWQRTVGYVPQQIFLSDDTIAGNIAFGVPPRLVDREAVEQAARTANLHDFILKNLPDGYETFVGERGVRLSGGQRQRIGIARALYRDPQLLILDEATSALDNVTERAVMDAVHNLGGQKTLVLVAHRLSTVRECDCIHLVEGGQVVASGTYDALIDESAEFRALAELG